MARVLCELGSGRAYGFGLSKKTKVPLAGIYVVLSRLEERGFIVGKTELKSRKGRVIPRRYYRLTPVGRVICEALLAVRNSKIPVV